MLCSWYPNRVQPTNGNFVEKHVRLVATSHHVTVLQVEHDPSLKNGQIQWVNSEENGYQMLTVYFGWRFGKLIKLLFRLLLFWKAFLRLRQQGETFDLVHVHVAMPGVLLGYLWKKCYQLPFLLSCHASGFLSVNPTPYPFFKQKMLVWAANAAERVCPVSRALQLALQERGLTAPVTVIPNVVNTQLFQPPAKRQGYSTIRLLHISNFDPIAKNVKGILRVASTLAKEGFPFHLTIAGDGDLVRVQEYAEAIQLSKQHYSLLGTLSEQEVAQQMQAHHAFILFSNYETQGVTLLEALCCGMQVIGTTVGGIPEIIETAQAGLLVSPGDEFALSSAIKSLPPSVDNSQTARLAQAHYGQTAVLEQLQKVYASIQRKLS
jgi:glycosyltransferase involved in cell wall biosynthesis